MSLSHKLTFFHYLSYNLVVYSFSCNFCPRCSDKSLYKKKKTSVLLTFHFQSCQSLHIFNSFSAVALCFQQDSFVVCTFSPQTSSMKLISEIPLKLTRKCLDMFGSSPFDSEVVRRTISKSVHYIPVITFILCEF